MDCVRAKPAGSKKEKDGGNVEVKRLDGQVANQRPYSRKSTSAHVTGQFRSGATTTTSSGLRFIEQLSTTQRPIHLFTVRSSPLLRRHVLSHRSPCP